MEFQIVVIVWYSTGTGSVLYSIIKIKDASTVRYRYSDTIRVCIDFFFHFSFTKKWESFFKYEHHM